MYGNHEFVVVGGLATYDARFTDSFRRVGIYVGGILKGDRPDDLAVIQPRTFKLVSSRLPERWPLTRRP